MPAIRNNKEVFTTTLSPHLLENLRQYCWENGKKINEVLDCFIEEGLRSKKKIKSCLEPGENKESKM